jgi:hypothetical protein
VIAGCFDDMIGSNSCLLVVDRFVNCEDWRKKFGTDDLPRTFEYPEKPEVFKFYPQYYHKTDKVRFCRWWRGCCYKGLASSSRS